MRSLFHGNANNNADGGRITRGMKVARKRKATPTKRPQSDPQQRVLPKDNSRAGSSKIGGPRVSCGRSPTPINRDGREGSKSESQQPYNKGGLLTTTRWTHNSALTASCGARAWYSFLRTARTQTLYLKIVSNNLNPRSHSRRRTLF